VLRHSAFVEEPTGFKVFFGAGLLKRIVLDRRSGRLLRRVRRPYGELGPQLFL